MPPPKLLPRTEVDATSAREEASAHLRIKELADLEYDWRLKLGKAEKEFNETLVKNRKKWEEEEAEHQEDVQARKKEIDSLEAKRLNLLIPVDILNKSAESNLKEAESMLGSIRKRESDAEILTEQLQDKLDLVGERETNLDTKEKLLEARIRTQENREKAIEIGEANLTQAIANFAAEMIQRKKEIDELATKNIMRERTLDSKEAALNGKEKSLDKEAVYLKDQRAVLERAFAEVRRREAKIPQAQ